MIAILAPYDRSETTLAALRVADLALASGLDVFYLVSGSKCDNIHRYWDSKSISLANKDKLLKLLPAKINYVLTFGVLPLARWKCVPKLGLVNAATWYDCVISPYELVRAEADGWKHIHRLIAPSESVYRMAMAAGYLANLKASAVAKVRWSSGDDSSPTIIEQNTRFGVICDHGCLREYPEIWISTMEQYLRHTDDTVVSTYLTGSLPRRARSQLKLLQHNFSGRFSVQKALCTQDFLIWLRDQDIAVYPSCRSVFGMYPAICKAMRVPIIAADISPISEHTPDGINSRLINLPKQQETIGVERCQFDTTKWLNAWLDVTNNPHGLFDLSETAEKQRAKAEREFVEFWRSTWKAVMSL